MPFRVSAGTRDNITRKRIVSKLAELRADPLALLAGYKYIRAISPPLVTFKSGKICMSVIMCPPPTSL